MNLELNIHPLLMFVDIGFEQVSFVSIMTMGGTSTYSHICVGHNFQVCVKLENGVSNPSSKLFVQISTYVFFVEKE